MSTIKFQRIQGLFLISALRGRVEIYFDSEREIFPSIQYRNLKGVHMIKITQYDSA